MNNLLLSSSITGPNNVPNRKINKYNCTIVKIRFIEIIIHSFDRRYYIVYPLIYPLNKLLNPFFIFGIRFIVFPARKLPVTFVRLWIKKKWKLLTDHISRHKNCILCTLYSILLSRSPVFLLYLVLYRSVLNSDTWANNKKKKTLYYGSFYLLKTRLKTGRRRRQLKLAGSRYRVE